MSDPHAHHGHEAHSLEPAKDLPPVRLAASYTEGGHEVDATPNRNLFGFLAVMVVILIVAAIGVYQLFVTHTDGQLSDAASVPAAQLEAQKAREHDFATTFGKVTVEGQPPAYRVPFAEARRLVVATPSRFAAAPAPQGWIHPDDAGKK